MHSNLDRSTLLQTLAKAKFVVAAFVALAVATVGAAVPASALAGQTPPSKAACKNGGWQQYGFSNQGQCVREAVGNPGNGYGGGDINVDINININIHGSNNIIVIVIPPIG